jgi:hypothetical protein
MSWRAKTRPLHAGQAEARQFEFSSDNSERRNTVRLPRCLEPASYSGQLLVLCNFLTYPA